MLGGDWKACTMRILLAIDGSKFLDAATQAVFAQAIPEKAEVRVVQDGKRVGCASTPCGLFRKGSANPQELRIGP